MKAILTYHSLDDSGSPISVAPEAFRRHMAWLATGPVRVVPLEALAAVEDGVQAVALTFDDAFANVATVAAPVLAEFDLPATVYVVSDHVGGQNTWGGRPQAGIPTLPLLGWDGLGRLQEQGVALGNHTRSHPDLTRMSPDAVAEEWAAAQTAIQTHTGVTPASVAYPYGRTSDIVATLAGEHASIGVTTELRPLGPEDEPLLLPRLDMYYWRDDGQLEAWGTARFERRLWLRRQARRLRHTLTPAGGSHD